MNNLPLTRWSCRSAAHSRSCSHKTSTALHSRLALADTCAVSDGGCPCRLSRYHPLTARRQVERLNPPNPARTIVRLATDGSVTASSDAIVRPIRCAAAILCIQRLRLCVAQFVVCCRVHQDSFTQPSAVTRAVCDTMFVREVIVPLYTTTPRRCVRIGRSSIARYGLRREQSKVATAGTCC